MNSPNRLQQTFIHKIELGCVTAYVSAWLARRGARSRDRQLRVEDLIEVQAPEAGTTRYPFSLYSGRSGGRRRRNGRLGAAHY